MSGRISSKGQITVPKSIRDALGIKPGDTLDFSAKDGLLILRPRKAWTVGDLCGSLRAYAKKGKDIRGGHRPALAAAWKERERMGGH